jgi:hypothetical protein
VALDDWSRVVFKRAVRATWAIWAVLTLSHVWFWADECELKKALIVPLVLLLSTRWMPRESWGVAGHCRRFAERPFDARILYADRWLGRAHARAARFAATARDCSGRRGSGGREWPLACRRAALRPRRARRSPALAGRLCAGLAPVAWTSDWSRGALPGHSLWLDFALTVVLLGMLWAFRAYAALAPLTLSYFHLGVQSGTLCAPRTRAQWGLSEVGLGLCLVGDGANHELASEARAHARRRLR